MTILLAVLLVAGVLAVVYLVLLDCTALPGPATRLQLSWEPPMRYDQKVTLTISPVDAGGNTAPVSDIRWRVAGDTSPGTLAVAENRYSAVLTSEAVGMVTVEVFANNAAGEELTATATIPVEAGVAVDLRLVVGEPA